MSESLDQAARFIAEHRLALRPLPSLTASMRPSDEATAYAVQERLHNFLRTRGLGVIAG